MKPNMNIECVRADRFTYRLGATLSFAARDAGDLFDSLERCLRDAGESLHAYFDDVSICYDGVPLGTHSVERLRAEPVRVMDELGRRWWNRRTPPARGKP
jgi:hypothetical protein